jgi:hypothetical protein
VNKQEIILSLQRLLDETRQNEDKYANKPERLPFFEGKDAALQEALCIVKQLKD